MAKTKRLSPRQKLFRAIADDDLKTVKAIFARNRNPRKLIEGYNADGETPLHAACWNDRFEIAAFLLSAGAEVGAWDKHGNTPLHDACRNPNPKAAAFVLKHGAGIYERDDAMCCTTPIDLALAGDENLPEGQEEMKELLRVFIEHAPNDILNAILELSECSARSLRLEWFQELAPELYFSKFCTSDISPGGSL